MKWSDYKIKSVEKDNKNFPEKLHELKKTPHTLYYRGTLKKNLNKTLGVVGSRRMTSYGRQALEKILPNIIDQGVTIISGFMYGVDTLAHTLAVEKNAPTIAVLGNGINVCYPVENEDLYKKILENNGAVISDYEPDIKAKPYMFVQRNRIIAALSTIGVLVVEASEKSGSLVTAKYAEELEKPLFAIPGPITSSVSSGTNYLIKSGKAKLVTSSDDIIKLAISGKDRHTRHDGFAMTGLNKQEQNIVDLLKNEQLSIDELSIKLGVTSQEISPSLTLLLMKGVLEERQGKFLLKLH